MKHFSVILRQMRRSSKQAGLFVLCVFLCMTTLTAISGFARSVERALRHDARRLHAADIIVRSDDVISAPLMQTIERLADQGRIQLARVYEFYSVVRATDEKASVLAGLKVVAPGYPFYGQVKLQSGRAFSRVLVPGSCVAEQTLLDRTGLAVGDRLKVGYASLRIADVVTAEPDRPLEGFAFGPRLFIPTANLESLGLMAFGSRIRRSVLIKVTDPVKVEAIALQLKNADPPDGARIDTYMTAGSVVKRLLDNFLFFLKLVGLFTLLISGLGMQSTLTAFFKEKQATIAIMKTVGATGRFIVTHFLLLVFVLGGTGAALGVPAGLAVQNGLVRFLTPFLPAHLNLVISWAGIFEALLLGLAVVVLFSLLPLYRLKGMRPVIIFSHRPAVGIPRWPDCVCALMVLSFFLALVLVQMRDIRFGLYFVGALFGMILSAALLTRLALAVIKRVPVRRLVMRQAIRGLFRQGNATRAVMITLTVSLAVIFSDHLIERNLNAAFVQSFPADSPNVYFVDIQSDQTEAFSRIVGQPVRFYPIVRARITAVNDADIDPNHERRQRRDNLSRVFNLTYRSVLLDDEKLIEGDTLFRGDWTGPQVSVMDTVVEMQAMKIGDRLTFKIQGVPLTARIASIRMRASRSLSPFFYFVFPEAVLEKAPQTLFAALRVAPGQMGPLQSRIVSRFPNISVIDLSQTIGTFIRLMEQLSRILRSFAFFSIAAGILILISAVFATRAERMMESVYYKILGAGRRFVFTVFALENLLIGLFSSALALIMAHAGAFWVCALRFDIGYRPFLPISLMMIGLTVLVVVGVGLAASRSIMTKKPTHFLRELQNE